MTQPILAGNSLKVMCDKLNVVHRKTYNESQGVSLTCTQPKISGLYRAVT